MGKNFVDILKSYHIFFYVCMVSSGIIFAALVCFVKTYNNEKAYGKENGAVILFIGIILWFCSAAVIGITEKYQREILQSYYPHIPVYIEYFGFILILFWICYRLLLSIRSPAGIRRAAAVVLCFTGCLNHFFGNVYKLNYCKETKGMYLDIPDAYKQAITAGLFDHIQQDDTVLIDISYIPTIYGNYFAQCAGRPISAERIDVFAADMKKYDIKNGRYYPDHDLYITKHFHNDDASVVYLDKILFMELDENMDHIENITVSSISSWCKSKDKISSLTLADQNRTYVLQLEDCAAEQLGVNEYLIAAPEGSYDYHSYTFWQ